MFSDKNLVDVPPPSRYLPHMSRNPVTFDLAASGQLNGLVPMDNRTAQESLAAIQKQLAERFGPDYNPVLRLAEIAEQAVTEGDLKTAVSALNSVADRVHGKIKAIEITDKRPRLVFVSDTDEGEKSSEPSTTPPGADPPRLVS